MLESRAKIAAQLVHVLSGEAFHEGAKRKLINLASPILNPTELQACSTSVSDRNLRDKNRLIAKRREDGLIDVVVAGSQLLSEVPNAENTVERWRTDDTLVRNAIEHGGACGIIRAKRTLPIGQVSEAARELAAIRIEVIQKFRCAFILPYTNVPIVGRNRRDAIVANLMNVLG